jgi:hypothetical protein
MNDFSDYLKTAGIAAGVVATAWAVLKDKIAADLAPKLELYFCTRNSSDTYRNGHQADHRLLESQVATVAEHKAQQAINPLLTRVDAVEKQFTELNLRVEESRKENREDFAKLFDRLDEMTISITRISTKQGG